MRQTTPTSTVLFFLLGCLAAALRPAAAADDLRLDRRVVPVAQSIRLVVDARQATYSGSVRVELAVREAAESFRFHSVGPRFTRLALTSADGRETPVTHTPEAPEDTGLVRVVAETPLAPSAYALEIDFENDFDTTANSLYRVTTGGESYTFTQFEAVAAREAFPCWDEPSFKLPYQLTVVVPAAHLAVSNTPVERETVEGEAKTVVFRRTPPLPTYLLALATGPLETVPIPGLSVPGRVVTVKGQSHLANHAVAVTPPLLAELERWFGRPYPFAKLDLIAVPEFWPGAMENAGAITFAESGLLLPPAPTAPQRRWLAVVTAHELAHMWFGDLVTMAWWDDLWLNEAFATWMGNKAAERVFPELRIEVSEVQVAQRAMATDAGPSARAVRRPVAAGDNIVQAADELAYHKGRAVLGMFERWLGEEAFRRGVLDYLKEHEWDNATAADLWGALGRAAGRDVGAAMSTFLDQPGIPLVTVETLPGGRVRLAQRRFSGAGVEIPAGRWRTPVVLRWGTWERASTTAVLLDEPAETVELGAQPAWIYPNADAGGYYRWSVEPRALLALAERAPAALSLAERIELVGNLAALLDAGGLSGAELLEVLARSAADPDPQVVGATLAALGRVEEDLVTPDLAEPFAAWVRRTLGPALERIGPEPRPGEHDAATTLRPQLLTRLAEAGRDEAALAHAERLARAYMADPAAVHPSLAGPVLALAARRGDRALFDEYRRRLEAATTSAERARWLGALASFGEPALADAALAYALGGPLRPQEVWRLVAGALDAPVGPERVWAWLVANYEALAARVPPDLAGGLPALVSGCSAERLAAAEAFFGTPGRRAAAELEMAKLRDRTAQCLRLRQREGPALAAHLRGEASARR